MQLLRPAFALNPKLFGKARMRDLSPPSAAPFRVSDDLKLFATTFLAGFVCVSILIS
ncbi:MAG TPA: hypothetical protein VH392_02635 [Sphingomicrobium sp.]|jgi:hypothetical protein